MILDRIEMAHRYATLHADFAESFRFLADRRLADLPAGRHAIRGDRLYAVKSSATARRREDVVLEAHRRFIDIQFVLRGIEEMGWRSRLQCGTPSADYDAERDLEFFADRPSSWVTVKAGEFAVFFPEDAHAPLAGSGEIVKVVLKVARQGDVQRGAGGPAALRP
jgi:biofilm protein TabA